MKQLSATSIIWQKVPISLEVLVYRGRQGISLLLQLDLQLDHKFWLFHSAQCQSLWITFIVSMQLKAIYKKSCKATEIKQINTTQATQATYSIQRNSIHLTSATTPLYATHFNIFTIFKGRSIPNVPSQNCVFS